MIQYAKGVAGLAALALIIYGLSPLADDNQWLASLWGATILAGFAIWPIRRQRVTGIHGGTQNLALVLLIGFVMMTVQLLNLQVVRSDEIYHRTVTDTQGNTISNVRLVYADQKIKRGTIFDSQGVVLAENRVLPSGSSYRTYPIADTGYQLEAMGHVLGFASAIYGLSGIELSYDSYLTGKRGNTWDNLQNDLLNQPINGNDIQLTINAQLQLDAYNALAGRTGSVVVIDVETGAIRAMVSTPAFDPRQLTLPLDAPDRNAASIQIQQYWQSLLANEGRPLINRAVQGLYPPGSTFKAVTAVAALNHANIADPEDISCPNELVTENGAPPVVNAVDQEENYIVQRHGPDYGLDAVFAFSCNTAFAQYGLRLEEDGANLLAEQAERFHIYPPNKAPDSSDLTDLQNTLPSTLFSTDDAFNQPVEIADTAFGQGQLQVTPLQMAQVVQAIGNDGVMLKPYLVESVRTPAGAEVYQARPREIGTPMSGSVAERMKSALRAVVEAGWPGATVAGVAGVDVGGKSGTAENPFGAPHAWFISLAPLDDPKYAVAVMVENGGEGTSVGGGIAGQVMASALAINP